MTFVFAAADVLQRRCCPMTRLRCEEAAFSLDGLRRILTEGLSVVQRDHERKVPTLTDRWKWTSARRRLSP